MSSGPEIGRLAPTPPPSVEGGEQSLLQAILRRRKRYVVVTTAVAVLATIALTLSQTKTYSATSTVVVQAPPGAVTGPNMATEAQVARSIAVADRVASALRLKLPPTQLLPQLSVRVPADSEVLRFAYSSPVPKTAQKRAQAFAKAFADVRREQFQGDALASAQSIGVQIQSMTAEGAELSQRIQRADPEQQAMLRFQRDALTTEIALLQQKLGEVNRQTASFSPARVLGSADLPKSPAKPNVPLNIFLGLVGGLLLGFGIAAIAEYVDNRIRGTADLAARVGAPVLGLIPKDEVSPGALTLVAIDAPGSDTADAFRRLRTNFIAAATHARTKSVAITSIDHSDSPIELQANLAAALAEIGKRVVLVSTRRRHPALEELVGAPPGPGFLDALAGTASLEQAICDTGVENLLLCRAGSAEANDRGDPLPDRHVAAIAAPARAYSLGSVRTARLIEELADRADFVLVDAPPLLADADGASLARACDGVLAVATPSATRGEIARSREQFERVEATVLGSVLVEPNQPTGKERQRPARSAAAAEEKAERRMRVSSADRRQSIRLARASISAETGEKG
jgi:succinoglycan biosynthesis transport protein ExoP